MRVGAFRCEESSNFAAVMIGSGLITKEAHKQDIGHLTAKTGDSEQIFASRGLNLIRNRSPVWGALSELHIEQERSSRNIRTEVGIVGTVVGPIRYRVY